MATVGFNGRELVIEWDGTIIKGVKKKSVTISREAVDITSDDDSGHRTLLATPGIMSSEWQVEGVTSDEVLIAAILTGSPYSMTDATMTLPTGGEVEYAFFLSTMEITGEHDGAYEFTATLMSSGAPTYTPGA